MLSSAVSVLPAKHWVLMRMSKRRQIQRQRTSLLDILSCSIALGNCRIALEESEIVETEDYRTKNISSKRNVFWGALSFCQNRRQPEITDKNREHEWNHEPNSRKRFKPQKKKSRKPLKPLRKREKMVESVEKINYKKWHLKLLTKTKIERSGKIHPLYQRLSKWNIAFQNVSF